LSGANLYGHAHGVAGIVDVLLKSWALYRSETLRIGALGGLATLHRTARPLGEDACWWPPDDEDDTCWNAWCHGTPGVVKTLSQAVSAFGREEDQALLEKALRGMMRANNGGFCLCHGVASRLDAYVDALPHVHGAFRKELKAAAARDVALLESLDLDNLHGAGGEPALGLMTGALGVLYALDRWRKARAQ
jgi:lantibiotic modifying enzyme